LRPGTSDTIWARIAALSFGGPAGQIAVMHRILVEERRWISAALCSGAVWMPAVAAMVRPSP
jgi:chromate transport protein ChrA